GQISQPIRSPQGFHIIKVLDSRQRSATPVIQTRARHILIRPDEVTSAEEVRARLRRLRERIVNGEDFAELARVHSQDPGSASQGGELGWVSPGELEPGFEEVMNQLSPGQVSEPFGTPFGWHIVQVEGRRQGEDGGDAEKARVREALAQRKADEQWEQWLGELRDEAYVEIRL
ncbi:MAG: peptidylprolyl isomerase, partial [Candidatus Competibacteraceae bacterium]|nr:peptidylprolyl isomerase [Candidatus Competibacteraceae bacterium]